MPWLFRAQQGLGVYRLRTRRRRAVKGAGNDTYDAFITNQCGLHVHIEAAKNLRVLKELAVLLIVYEGAISRMHSPCRKPGQPSVASAADRTGNGISDLLLRTC